MPMYKCIAFDFPRREHDEGDLIESLGQLLDVGFVGVSDLGSLVPVLISTMDYQRCVKSPWVVWHRVNCAAGRLGHMLHVRPCCWCDEFESGTAVKGTDCGKINNAPTPWPRMFGLSVEHGLIHCHDLRQLFLEQNHDVLLQKFGYCGSLVVVKRLLSQIIRKALPFIAFWSDVDYVKLG